MFSKIVVAFVLAAVAASVIARPSAQTLPQPTRGALRFYPDDPLWRDDDMRSIAAPAAHDLSKSSLDRFEVRMNGTAQSRATVPPDVWGPVDGFGVRYAVAKIGTQQPEFPHWSHPVVVTIRNRNGLLDVVGIDRPTDLPDVVGNRRVGEAMITMATISRFLVLMMLTGFKTRISILFNWTVAFLGRGRTRQVITAQKVLARRALDEHAPESGTALQIPMTATVVQRREF
jgi:hypothetical protein